MFVHLHVHTDYSLLDGAQRCADVVKQAAAFGMPAVAVTDHGNMSAAYELIQAAQKAGVKPIIGCEFYVTPGDYQKRDNSQSNYHLVCLAENHEGYVNLCHLNAEAWLRGFYYKPRIDKALLRRYSKGIIALSACIGGEIPALLLQGRAEAARMSLEAYLDIFGPENFFIELQDHGLDEQKEVNPKLVALARAYGVGLVATNDSHYLIREHAEAQDLFLCIATQTNVNDPKRMKFTGSEFYFKSEEEMAALFPEWPEALENTGRIAERCEVRLPTVDDDRVNHYPEYPVPDGSTREEYLRRQCWKGITWRYGFDPEGSALTAEQQGIIARADYELGVIRQTGFVSYFLVVWDFLNYAASIGVPLGPGRGSGAGSIVAYLLGITHIDPLHYGLLFERFLNPDRVSPPDFDIDLCERRRYEVIEYVRNKYGAANVVQIGTFGTLKAKAVVKDVARAMGRSVEEGNRISKMIPADPKMTLKIALHGDGKSAEESAYGPNQELQEVLASEPWVQQLWNYAVILEGMNRNMSIHAAGVIIGDQAVANIVPIAKGQGDESITQFQAGPCESLGLLKMDFLGLKTLTVIQDALDLIAGNTGRQINSNDIPIEDQATFDLLNKGLTVAVFQLESTGMRNLCRRFGVNRLEDIIALIALYRPGPMQFLDEFIGRKMGRIPVEYEVPEMAPILAETYGIMLYQEQVMQVVQAVAGFSLGNADILRRAMGKKKKEVMQEQFAAFQAGCRGRGVRDEVSQSIWDKIEKFAGYGFNKSHSAAYGMLSYRTAWLKANYQAEFMAAVLTSELGNAEKLAFYLKECRDLGVQILPPDVNVCGANFSVDGQNIRFGLAAVKGVGTAAVNSIVAARTQGGKFKGLLDFCERVDGNSRKNMENLIKVGALDCFGLRRSQLLAVCEDALALAQQTQKDRKSGQGSLFDLMAPEEKKAAELNIPDLPEWEPKELLQYEKELLGFYVSGHPMAQYQPVIDRYQLDDLSDLPNLPDGFPARVAAYVTAVSMKSARKDNRPWTILTVESRESTADVLVFADKYAETQRLYLGTLRAERVVFIEGEVSRRDPESPPSLLASRVIPVESATEVYTAEAHIHIPAELATTAALMRLRDICAAHPGVTPVLFACIGTAGDILFFRNHDLRVCCSAPFVEAVEAWGGAEHLVLKPDRKRPPTRRNGNWKRKKEGAGENEIAADPQE